MLLLVAAVPALANQTVNGITINEDLDQARRGVAYSYTVPVISGGTAPYTFSLIGPSVLPIRLTLAANGTLTGVISCNVANGSYRQDVRVTDSSASPIVADFTGNKGLAINVTAGPAGTCVALTLTPAALPTPTAGSPYSQTITASGGLGPYTYSVSAGALPSGLTLNAGTGQISGTPISGGAYSFSITATDAADSTGSLVYSGTVNAAVAVNPASLPGGTVGVAYSQTVSPSGGNGAYTLGLSSGALPAGLSFNAATGVISGTPVSAATGSFTITATDGNGATGSRSYTITVSSPVSVNPATLPSGTVGTPYSQTVSGSGGSGAYTYAVSAGSLPAGLSLNASTGAIAGTPSSAASSTFTINATDGNGATGSRSYTVSVNPAVTVNPSSLPGGTVGLVYSQTLTATGGSGSYTFSVTAGALPTGLTLNTGSGVLSGTPSSAGISSFTITATDGNGATGSRAFSVAINSAITVNPSSLPAGAVGSAYSQTISAAGGSGAYTFSVTAGTLPAGLALNASSGVLSGTPSSAAASSFTVTATDGSGATGARAYSLTINPAIAVNPASLAGGTVGSAYSQTVSATGGSGSYTYSISAGALPAGLTLNAASGVISGTPTTAATGSFTVRATDGAGAFGTRAYTVTIAAASIVVNPASLPAATVGTAYSQTVSATGGTGSYTWSISVGALPAGLLLNASSGVISGTPTTAGASSFTIRATDGSGAFGTRAYTVTTNAAVTVNPATLPNGTVGSGYSRTITATGGVAPYTYSVVAGALPAGLTLNASTGVLAGTPTTAAATSFTLQATASNGAIGTRAYSVTINPAIVVNPVALPGGTLGTVYSQTVSATGGTGTYTFSRSAGTLPTGVTLNATTGVLSGTPTATGTRSFTIRATDGSGAFGSRAYSVTIAAAIVVNPATLPGGSVGSAYNRTISATGGTGAKTFSVSAGALPAGLSLNATTGVISGTPTSAGSNSFTIQATDSVGAIGARAYTVTINAAITLSPTTLPNGTSGTPYSRTIAATGGTGAFTYSVSAGSLGGGLTLNAATGLISGTPTTVGARSFTIRATDGNGAFGTQAYSITINAAITVNPTTLANGTVGTAYSRTVSATGGTGSYSYSVSVGSLPAGLTLNASSGVISGTPTTTGASPFTIRATDTLGAIGSRAYTVTIAPAPIVVSPSSLPGGAVGAAYSQVVGATGGTGGYTFSVSAGSLGTGLTLNASTGLISGTPTTAGTRSFTIRAQDSSGAAGTRAYSVIINAAIVVNPATLPGGTTGTAYSQTITSTGGSGTYTYVISAGALPAGLVLNTSSGVISGTPTTAASSSFTVRATDGNGASGTRAYTVTIAAAPIVVNPSSLPNGAVGSAYSEAVSAAGGSGSFTYSVSAGALPAGLTLNAASGVISGTPSTAAASSFTIRATDGTGAFGTRAYTVTITAAPIVVNPASLPAATVGTAYSQTLSASGGTGSYTWSVSAGALPAGLTLNAASGVISGTPTTAGASSFTIRATDGSGAFGTRAYNVTTNAAVSVNPATLPNGAVGVGYAQTVTGSGGTGTYTFSVSSGALPAGLALNASTGAITGTPSGAVASTFTITATDGSGATGSRSYTVTINAAIAVNPASLPNGTLGVAYAQTISATGGTGTFSYSVSAGSLPAGLSLNATSGAITGTPSAAATSSFTITATDGSGATGSRPYSVTINAAITVSPSSLPPGTVGAAYNQTATATGGTGTYAFSISAGTLPAGLTLNASTGAITGTPTTAATGSFTITATDGNGATGSRAFTFTVNAAVTVNPPTLPAGTVAATYSQTVSAAGGSGSYSYSLSAGVLPTGLSLNASTGVISGTPTAAAASSFTIRATDGNGAVGIRAYSVTINAGIAVNPASLPSAVVAAPFSQAVSATGGSGTYSFSISAGSLPAGLTLNASTGLITGTPSAAGTSNFTVTATDGIGATGSRTFTFTVNPSLALNPATLPGGTVGTAYSQAMTATGGSGTYTYTVSAGSLPAGLSLNPGTGLISGTPTSAVASSFTVTATDSNGVTTSRAFGVTINAAIAVNPAGLPNGTVGTAYTQTVAATGGNGTYTYSISSGSLPAGLALNAATGSIAGTPTTAATSNFTVTATDGVGATGSRAYTVVVVMATITLESTTLGNGVVGSPYTQSIVVSGGVAPYAYSIAAGQLPAGVVLNPTTGTFVGTPTVPGTHSFTVRVVDANGASGVFAQSIVVEPRPDPSQDPTVRGIAAAQMSAAGRFGAAQIQNVGARVRMLHLGQDPCSLQFDVGTNIRWERADPSTGQSVDRTSAAAPQKDDETKERKRCDSPIAVWVGGNIDFGFLRHSTATDRSDFTTSGLTFGADSKVMPGLVIGASLGYARDTTDVGSAESDSRARGSSVSLYGSYEPLKSVYIDFLLGYGSLDFDSTRWQDAANFLGGRSGKQAFGSLGVSGVIGFGPLQVSPYGRFDRVRSRLDAYVESGASGAALSFGEVTGSENVLAAGIFASYRLPVGRGTLEPSLRLEARRVQAPSLDQSLSYADMPGHTYVIQESGATETQALGGLGLVFRVDDVMSFGVEYSYTGSSGTYRSETVRAVLRAPF